MQSHLKKVAEKGVLPDRNFGLKLVVVGGMIVIVDHGWETHAYDHVHDGE